MNLASAQRLFEEGRLYELLQVPANAHGKELERACKLARVRHHPDKGGNHDLACLIDSAIKKLLSRCSNQSRATTPSYINLLDDAHHLLNGAIKTTEECIDRCGYGDNLPPCSRTGSCYCATNNIAHLQAVRIVLHSRMSWAHEVLQQSCTACTQEEFHLIRKLQEELERATDIARKCLSRVSLFEALGRQPRQKRQRPVEQPDPCTGTSMDSASSASSEQLPQDMDTGPGEEEQDQEMPAGTNPQAEEQQNQESPTDSLSQTASYFPRVSVWLKQREPEKATKLKQMWCEYRKVWNNRRMRIQRGCSVDDLDEQAKCLRQTAWQYLRE